MNSHQPRSTHSGSIGAQARDMLVSFLDFASSANTSTQSQSRSHSQRHSSSNKSTAAQSNVAIRSVTPIPEPPTPYSAPTVGSNSNSNGNGALSGSGSASTDMWTLSLSVEPPREPARVRDSQDLVPHTAVSASASPLEPPSNRHPFSMVSADLHPQVGGDSAGAEGEPESPTDSLPISVSDINFRNDEEEEEDISQTNVGGMASGLRTGTSGTFTPARSSSTTAMPRFQLPRHPPLPAPRTSPSTPQSYTYAYNAPTPTRLDYGTDLGRSAHMRQMSAPDLGARAAYGQAQARAPYEAQTTIGRRLAQVRAQAREAQTQTQATPQAATSQTQAGGDVQRPPSRGLRALPLLPFIHHLNRSGSGSGS